MLFKEETACEKCIHKRVCDIRNIQEFCDAIQRIEKLSETISDIFEFSVRCKEFKEDVAVSVRTPSNIHRMINEKQEANEQEDDEVYYDCNTCVHFCHEKDIYGCVRGNIYPSEDPSPICINCECYTQNENANENVS